MRTNAHFPKHFIPFFVLGFTLILFLGISEAASHYVSLDGSYTWGESTNINTPCSALTAMSNAVAGDTVYFRGGTYNLGTCTKTYYAILEPSNSGSSGNPITFAAYPGETPVMDGTEYTAARLIRIFGVNAGKDYITFDGFTLKANGGTKMPSIVLWGGDGISTGCTIKNCTFNGGTDPLTWTDNVEAIRLERTENALVQNCMIYNYTETNNYANTAAIKMYANNHATIENCEIANCSTGIYVKGGDNDNTTIRHNWSYGCYRGIYNNPSTYNHNDNLQIYNNVIVNNDYNIWIVGSTNTHADDCEIYNNTIYGSTAGIFYSQGKTWKIYNNIIHGCANKQYMNGYDNVTVAQSDHNQFGDSPLRIVTHLYQGNSQKTYTSMDQWNNSDELEGENNHPGEGSLASDPKFVNSSGNMNQLEDFRLAPDSPCKGAGRGGVDMGADISLVGLYAASEVPQVPPAAPQNLRIVAAN